MSNEMRRKCDIINALAKLDKPTAEEISEYTGIPLSTVKRQIGSLRADFKMSIEYVRRKVGYELEDGRKGKGYYILARWGIISRQEFYHYYMLLK